MYNEQHLEEMQPYFFSSENINAYVEGFVKIGGLYLSLWHTTAKVNLKKSHKLTIT